MTRRFGHSGQATVEVVALLPLLALAGLAIMQLLAAGAAREYAGHAAEAAAMAVGEGRDPAPAARDAIPGWSAHRLTVHTEGRRVEVELRPPSIVRAIGDLLAAHAQADAGPAAR
jgi:uncharacterized protein (UPF0548 family)